MRIAVIGQAQFGHDVLNKLLEANKNIVGISSPSPKKETDSDPLSILAKENDIPNIYTDLLKQKKYADQFINDFLPDLIVFAFVNDIIPKNILDAATIGSIQYHPSLLPKYRGRSAMNWAIFNGENKTGISIFWVDEGIDTGPILLQKEAVIEDNDSVASLYFNKLYPLGIEAMIEAVELTEKGKAPKINQNESESNYDPPFDEKYAQIDWSQNVDIIHNQIRASDPQPGAYTYIKNTKIFLYQSNKMSNIFKDIQPGTIIKAENNSVIIVANKGSLKISKVKIDGDKKSAASEILNIEDQLG
jgi:methionyl-tRNA formyltransferase